MYRFINVFEKKTHFSTRSKEDHEYEFHSFFLNMSVDHDYDDKKKEDCLPKLIEHTYIYIKINV